MKSLRCTTRFALAAFTLVELLTVIAIISVLMTLLFSVVGSAKESARRMKAKHDLLQLTAAVNAYLNEYGVYPLKPAPQGQATEVTFATSNSDLMSPLTATASGANEQNILNPRRVVFIEPPLAKDPQNPRSGLANGNWYDPWGIQPGKPESGIYHVRIDAAFNGYVSDPYPGDSGRGDGDDSGGSDGWKPKDDPVATIHASVISWSLAKTGVQTYELQDQVLSWK